MTVLIPYLIKLSISLAVVYLFYRLFLRRLTFYNWNRWYLIVYTLVSFYIPFINIYPVLEKNNWSSFEVLELIPALSYQVNPSSLSVQQAEIPWTFQDWSLLLIASGVAIMLLRLIIQQISFIRIRRASTLLLDEKIKVYQVNKKIIPFSYGNSIFVNQHLHSQEELKEIIRHEFIHVKQKHTMDIIWGELLCILNWYNPFAWLIRKSIRQNLEFIADNKVLQNGIDKKEYQYLLLKVIGVSHFSVATQFNFSSLKKRIAMMNKIKSAKVHLIKFLFLLPLFAVLLLAFRNEINEANKIGEQNAISFNVENDKAFTNLPLDQSVIVDTVPGKWKLPANVSNISITDGIATVKLKNGTVETYNLNNDEELASFEKKYGKVPPPPPHPPVPTTKPGNPPPPPPYPDTREHVRVEPKENSKGYIVSIADNNGECVVIIKDKDKRIVKAMSLNEWNDHEFENAAKYGEIPPAPPPAKAIPAVPVPTTKTPTAVSAPVKSASPVVPAPGIDQGIISAPSVTPFQATPVKPSKDPVKPAVRIRSVLSPNDEILYIIDGVKQPQGEHTLNNIDPNNIESIEILKEGAGKTLYGGQNFAGVIIIKTKSTAGKNSVGLDKLDGFEGLIIVDGDEMKKEELNEKIKTENIESVNILRIEEAIKIYGEKGKKGVILIKTKIKKGPELVSLVKTTSYKVINSRMVAGIIIDHQTRKPIPGVKVYSAEMGFEATTDKNGYYFAHLTKQATELPRIFMEHPQYLSAMVSDASYDKQGDKDNSFVLFMGLHKGNPKTSTQPATYSLAQIYTLTTNKTPGYELVNEIMKKWLSGYDQQKGEAQLRGEAYIDRVSVKDGVMNWDIKKKVEGPLLYLLEGKIIGSESDVYKIVKPNEIGEVEFISGADNLKKYGEAGKYGVANFIRKTNLNNASVRLFPKETKLSQEKMDAMLAQAEKLNVLYLGIKNPLRINLEGNKMEDLEVKMENGSIERANDVFYAQPFGNPGNSKVDVYRKNIDGSRELINSRYFRVKRLNPYSDLITKN